MNPLVDPNRRSSRLTLALILLFVLHLAVLLVVQAPARVMFNTEPVSSLNYSQHYYQVQTTCQFLNRSQRAWGYDPRFLAGYPMGTLIDVDNKFVSLSLCSLQKLGLPIGLGFNLLILASAAFVPLIAYRSSRNFGFSPPKALLAAALASLFWHIDWTAHFTFTFGIFAFAFTSLWMTYVLSLGYQFVNQGRIETWIALCLASLLGSLFHALTFLLVFLPFGLYPLLRWRRMTTRTKILGLGLIPFVLIANLYWIIPLLHFLPLKTSSAFYLQGGPFFLARDLVQPFSHGVGLRWVLTALGLMGLRRLRLTQPRLIRSILTTFGFLFALAYFGFFFPPLREIEPYRNLLPATYLLIPFAADELKDWILRFKTLDQRVRIATLTVTLFICIQIGGNAVLLLLPNETDLLPTGFDLSPNNRLAGPRPDDLELAAWLADHTSQDHRILVESRTLAAMLGTRLEREMIGGPYPTLWLPHNYANFYDGALFGIGLGRPIESFSDQDLLSHFERYNIGWAVLSTDVSRQAFSRLGPIVELQTEIGPYAVYRIDQPADFVLEGSATVHAEYDRIEISRAEGDTLILAYHWMDTLQVPERMILEPVWIGDDPAPFIRVRAIDRPDFMISNQPPFPPPFRIAP